MGIKLAILAALALALSCGKLKPSDKFANRSDLNSGEAGEETYVEDLEIKFELKYDMRPAAVWFISGGSPINQAPFNEYFFTGNEHTLFKDELAFRLRNSKKEIIFSTFDGVFSNENAVNSSAGVVRAYTNQSGTEYRYIKDSASDFVAVAKELIRPTNQGNANGFRPFTVALKHLNNYDSRLPQTNPKDYNLVIISLSYMDARLEGIDKDMLKKKVAEHGNPSFVWHAIAPPKDGCSHEDSNGAQVKTNDHASVIGGKHLGKIADIVSDTGGVFHSICDYKTHKDFIASVVDQINKPKWVEKKDFDKEIDPATIKLYIASGEDKVEYKDWNFEAGDTKASQRLLVGTSAASGTQIIMTAKTKPQKRVVAKGSGSSDGDEIDDLKKQASSAAVEAYLAPGGVGELFAAGATATNCSGGGCHPANGANTNFANANDTILRCFDALARVDLPDTDANFMPRGKAKWAQADIDRLRDFCNNHANPN